MAGADSKYCSLDCEAAKDTSEIGCGCVACRLRR
jgi:hypothetical protein